MELMSGNEPPKVEQPTHGAFNLPTMSVATQETTVLCRWSRPSRAVRTDQVGAMTTELPSEKIAVGRSVLHEMKYMAAKRALADHGLDLGYLGSRAVADMAPHRQSVSVGEQESLGSLSTFGLTDQISPFFSGEKVASPGGCRD